MGARFRCGFSARNENPVEYRHSRWMVQEAIIAPASMINESQPLNITQFPGPVPTDWKEPDKPSADFNGVGKSLFRCSFVLDSGSGNALLPSSFEYSFRGIPVPHCFVDNVFGFGGWHQFGLARLDQILLEVRMPSPFVAVPFTDVDVKIHKLSFLLADKVPVGVGSDNVNLESQKHHH